MYESPIQIIQDEMIRRMENDVMNVVHSYGIKVEKDELVRALMYDRDQYNKGYKDGIREFVKRLKKDECVLYDESPYGDYYDSVGAVCISSIDSVAKELAGEY